MNLAINRESKTTITRQIYNQIKEGIHRGLYKGGYKLPSTRELAREWKISRNTVVDVFEQLHTEGYLYSKPGSGFYVCRNIELSIPDSIPDDLSLEKISMEEDIKVIDFKTGIPNLSNIPLTTLASISREVYLNLNRKNLGYSSPQGEEELRREIVNYVVINRGIKAHQDQVLITSGTTQAIGLITKIILKKNSSIAVEEPITKDIREIIRSYGGKVNPVELDEMGIATSELVKFNFGAVYTTPSHHYPLGITMPVERRVELINIAKEKNAYIVEDDYDSEYRYDAMAIPALQGLAPDRVIYIGTFSKTLFPSLRIAYIILPPELINLVRKEKWLVDLHNPVVDQLVLSKFINRGHYSRLISKQKKVYRNRRDHLIDEIQRNFKDWSEILGSQTGMHLSLKFPGIDFNRELIDKLYQNGVKVYCVEEHCQNKGRYKDTIVIGYGSLTREQITKGIEILSLVLSPYSGIKV